MCIGGQSHLLDQFAVGHFRCEPLALTANKDAVHPPPVGPSTSGWGGFELIGVRVGVGLGAMGVGAMGGGGMGGRAGEEAAQRMGQRIV